MDETYGKPFSNLALTYAYLEKYEEAVTLFKRSLELLTNNREKAISWNRLGKVYRHLKNYEQAVVAFQHADELEPECTEDSEDPGQMLYASSDPSGSFQVGPAPLPGSEDGCVPVLNQTPAEDVSVPVLNQTSVEDVSIPVLNQSSAEDVSVPVLNQVPAEPAIEGTKDGSTFTDLPQLEQDASNLPEATSLTAWLEVEPESVDGDWASIFSDEAETQFSIPETGELEQETLIPDEEVPGQIQHPGREESPEETVIPAAIEFVNWQPAEPVSFPHPSSEAVDPGGTKYQASRYAQDVAVDVLEVLPSASIIPVEKIQDAAIATEETPAPIESMDPLPGVNSQEAMDLEVQIEKYKRVVQINERNAAAWDALGTLYKSSGLYKEAILAHKQAISIEPSRASYYHHLGLDFAGAKRDEDAISAFQKVIELDPNHYLAHASLGGYYRKLGLNELAQKHIGKAMRNIYDNESEYNRACLEAISGNAEQAIALLQIALEKRQTYLEWVIHDPDLDFIRDDSRFKELISSYAG